MSKPILLEDLQEAFPGWCIWRSSAGRLWATRNGRRLTQREHEIGLFQTLDADDVPQLASLLKEQERVEQAHIANPASGDTP
ncbi:hypothetical protein [Nonomuraea longicatena]|uniref:hypothetical protein n=1 Tax=Nonomuraea longicatena TaxID=83682 RepID=UPI0031D84A4B